MTETAKNALIMADEKLKYIDITEVISECVENGSGWAETVEKYTNAMAQNELFFATLNASSHNCGGDTSSDANTFLCADLFRDDIEPNPLVHAIETDTENLFDIITAKFPQEALMDPDVLEAAALSHKGKYLERIENVVRKNGMDDYFEYNQENLLYIFDTHCCGMRYNRIDHPYNIAIKLFDLCPNGNKYQDATGCSFLRSAVENALDDVCVYLLDKQCSPTMSIDMYQTQTIYDYAFLKFRHRQSNIHWQKIMQSLRDHIPADKKKFWQEKEVALAEKDDKSCKEKHVIWGTTILLLAVSALALTKCDTKMPDIPPFKQTQKANPETESKDSDKRVASSNRQRVNRALMNQYEHI